MSDDQLRLDLGEAELPAPVDLSDDLPLRIVLDCPLVPVRRRGGRQAERDRIVAMFQADPHCHSVNSARTTTVWFLSSADQVATVKKQRGRDRR